MFHDTLKTRSQRAFTLVEIFVVITVIAILAGLTLSVVGSSKNAAKSTRCVNNLHQLGVAFGTYAADHDGKFPPVIEEATGNDPNESVWSNVFITLKYVPDPTGASSKNLFLCPFDPAAPFDGADGVRSYAYNALPEETMPVPPALVDRTVTTILLAEWYQPDPFANPDSSGWDSEGWACRSSGGIYAHHPDGTSGVLFYDLHVENVKAIPQLPAPESPLRWSFTSP